MKVPKELESDIIIFLKELFNGELSSLNKLKNRLSCLTLKAIKISKEKERLERENNPGFWRYRRYIKDVRSQRN